MEGSQNPRNREEDDADETPDGRSLTPRTPTLPNLAGLSSDLWQRTACTPATPSCKTKPVLLSDWWLVKAERASNGKRLCIGGVSTGRYRRRGEGCASGSLLSPRQKAERIFESAPITKRYDTSTLGTADGITVRIQGVINKARSNHNGFPPEVCSCFLIGFPYNWDRYADACFGEKPNSLSVPASSSSDSELSKGLTDAAGCVYPVYLDEFSLSRIRDVNFIRDDRMNDFMTRELKDFLTSMLPSELQYCTSSTAKSSLPKETSRKYVREKSSQKNEDGTYHVAGGHAVHADGGSGENSVAATTKIQQSVSFDSSSQLASQIDILPVKGTGIRKVTKLDNIIEPENVIQLARFVSAVLDTVNSMPNCIGEVNGERTISYADPGIESVLNSVLPKQLNSSQLEHDEVPGNVRRSNSFERTKTQNLGIYNCSPVRKVSDPNDANSSRKELDPSLEISSALSSKPSNNKEKGCRRSSRIASKLHPENIEKNENSELHVGEDSTAHIGSVGRRNNIASAGSKEPLTEPVGRRSRFLKGKIIQNDEKCTECRNRKRCIHKTATPHEYAGNMVNQSELNLIGKYLQGAADEMFSADNDAMNLRSRSLSASVVPSLYHTAHTGRIFSSSSRRESHCFDNRVMFSADTGMENVKEIPATDVKSSLPKETPSKYERAEISQKNDNGTYHGAKGHAADPSKTVGCHMNHLHADEVGGENYIAATTNIQHNVSFDSSFQLTSQIDSLPVKGTCIQKVTLLENIREPENSIHLARSVPMGPDTVNHLPYCIREVNGESPTSLADPGIKSVPSDMLPKKNNFSHPQRDEELGNVIPDGSERIMDNSARLSYCSLVRRVSDTNDASILRKHTNPPIEKNHKPAIVISSKVSNTEEKGCRRSSRIASKLHPELLRKNENSEFHVVKDSTTHIGSVDMRSNIASEVGLNKHLTEPLGRRYGLRKLKSLQKDKKCADSMNRKLYMDKTTATPSESSGNEIQSELELREKRLRVAMDEIFSSEHDARLIKSGNISPSIVRKLYYTTISGPMVGSSITSESQNLGKKVMFSANEGMEIVEEVPTTDATSVTKMTKSKNRRGDKQALSSLKAEKNAAVSAQVDHSFAMTVNDLKHKRRHKSACTTDRVVKFTFESSVRKLDIDPLPTSETEGCADYPTSVNSRHATEFFECSIANSTQSSTKLEMHSSKHKKLDVVINKARMKKSTEYITTKKKQSTPYVNPNNRKGRSLHRSGGTIWTPSYVNQSPLTREIAKKMDIALPESFNLKRSRSGRLLVPPIANWCQRILYAADGEITGITGKDPSNIGPPKKRKKFL